MGMGRFTYTAITFAFGWIVSEPQVPFRPA